MTTNTAALLRHLATIIGAITDGWSVRDDRNRPDGYHIPWPAEARMEAAGDALAALLKCGESWETIGAAVGAHADALAPVLPEGWTEHLSSIGDECSIYFVEEDSTGRMVFLTAYAIGTADWSGPVAPPAVYAYLLARAQGVGS